MPNPTAAPYRPIEAESSGVLTLLRAIAPLVLIACIVLSFFPEAQKNLPEGWRVPPTHLRIAAIVGFLALVANNASALARRSRARRTAISDFAASVGGRFSEGPYRPTASGWEGGPRVDYAVSGRAAVLSLDRGSRSSLSCRLSAELPLARDFQFQIVPGGKAMRFILSKSFLLPVLSMAVRAGGDTMIRLPGAGEGRVGAGGAAGSAAPGPGAPSREALQQHFLDRLRYLAADPVTIGDERFDRQFLVKASDASVGRALASDPSVRAALTALGERAPGFQLGLESLDPKGPARLIAGITSFDFSAETLSALDRALRAVLEAMNGLGLLERSARGAA